MLISGLLLLPGAIAYKMFQAEMGLLLKEMKARGPPPEHDQDIAAQLYRVMKEGPSISENRILSEIGILFIEGFETTGHTTSWTIYNIATNPGTATCHRNGLQQLSVLSHLHLKSKSP